MIPGYRSFELLGSGGSADVYRAWEDSLHRYVAVKVLRSGADDDRQRTRFEREKALHAQLAGRGLAVVPVFRADVTAAGQPFVVMQLYDGSVHDWLVREGTTFTDAQAVAVLRPIVDAVQGAHDLAVVHGDIKPENILLSEGGPGLADFGVAAVVPPVSSVPSEGTPGEAERLTLRHAAPEVLDGEAPTRAGDVWSLGSTLYRMLAAECPFELQPGESLAAFRHRVRYEPLPPIMRQLHGGLWEVLEAAMAKDLAARPDARDLRRRLDAIARVQLPTTAPTLTAGATVVRPPRDAPVPPGTTSAPAPAAAPDTDTAAPEEEFGRAPVPEPEPEVGPDPGPGGRWPNPSPYAARHDAPLLPPPTGRGRRSAPPPTPAPRPAPAPGPDVPPGPGWFVEPAPAEWSSASDPASGPVPDVPTEWSSASGPVPDVPAVHGWSPDPVPDGSAPVAAAPTVGPPLPPPPPPPVDAAATIDPPLFPVPPDPPPPDPPPPDPPPPDPPLPPPPPAPPPVAAAPTVDPPVVAMPPVVVDVPPAGWHTGGDPAGGHTIDWPAGGARPEPASPGPARGVPVWLPIVLVAGLAVAGLAAVVARSQDDGTGGDPGPDQEEVGITLPDSVPPAAVDPELVPSDFVADDFGSTVDLHWTDNAEGRLDYVVIYRAPGEEQEIVEVPAGVTSQTIRDLDPDAPYCFRLLGVGLDPDDEVVRASADTAVRGCEPEPDPDAEPDADGSTATTRAG